MSGTIGALKSLDPIKSANDGGIRMLMEAKNTGVGTLMTREVEGVLARSSLRGWSR
jgi:hypothetical protein